MYSFNFNGKKIDLPKCTRKIINDKVEITKKAIAQAKGEYDYFQLIDEMYEFVINIVGEDTLKEITQHEDVDDIDVKDLEIIFIEIGSAYDKKVEDYQMGANKIKLKNIVDSIPTKQIEQISNISQQFNK